MIKKNKKIFGFSLIEVGMVVVIVALAFPMILKGLYTALTKQVQTQQMDIIYYLAQEKMEEMRGLGYSGVSSATEDPISGYSGYKRVTVTSAVNGNFADSGDVGYRKVAVTVTHKTKGIGYTLMTVLRRRTY